MTDQAIADGCAGLRISGEMTWAMGSNTAGDRLAEYEKKLNQFFPTNRAQALCQYNRRRFGPDLIREVLRHHPLAVLGNGVYDNPFFEPADILGLEDSAPRRVARMLKQVRRHRVSRRFSHNGTS